MVIEINDNKTIRQIQEAFGTVYPYLKVEFLMHPAEMQLTLPQKDSIPVDKTIGQIKQTHVSALLEIDPSDTIAEVEKEFWFRFGLQVEILRRSDSHWILPEGADELTLQQQNEIGRTASDHIIHPDYDSRIEEDEY